MSSPTISRVRMHDLDGVGRSGLLEAGEAGFREPCASPRRCLTSTSGIGEAHQRGTPDHWSDGQPSIGRSRPETDDLMELLIWC